MLDAVEYSHVEVRSHEGQWSAEVRRIGMSPVTATMDICFDDVLFSADDEDAEWYANHACEEFWVDQSICLNSTKELAGHIRRVSNALLTINERLAMRRAG